ncbi:MAG TPA: type IV toxin-antitoxin system AbiEi family antitoxin domain-containing protein [Acidimicrobiia bacterium]|jgi:very-short-patch-repair endonuclease|nr:type IV toxin-antitoxin system AbiEi family antitoxin domain-containing protein [Acidimicrobiia bacterium]
MTTSVPAREIEATIRALARTQHGLVGRRQLRAEGIEARRLRPLAVRGSLERLSEGVYRVVGTPETPLQRVMAAILDAPPGAVASHQTAAALWNVPGFPLTGDVHVTIPRQGSPHRRSLAVVHYHKEMPLDEVVLRHGLPCTTPTLTAFQLCAVVHPARAMRAFDAMTVRRLTGPRHLRRLVKRIGASGRNGTRLARELSEQPSDQSPPESGLESRVEFLGKRAGLDLDRQIEVGDSHRIGRADFRVRDTTGLIEAQSLLYHSSAMDAAADRERLSRMQEAGFSILTVWDFQAFHQPEAVIQAMQAFKRRLDAGELPFHLDCGPPPGFQRV